MGLSRMTGESDFDYHKRIIYGKLEDKTLADYDYSELSVPAYGKQYSSTSTRKMFYGSKKTLDLLKEDGGESCGGEYDERAAELKKERQKYYDQRRELNKLLTEEARAERLQDVLRESARELNQTVGRLYSPSDETRRGRVYDDTEAVLVFSDWHYGLKTENIFNKFNTDICKKRVSEVTKKAEDRIVYHECRRLHIVVLGDLYHGAIHNSARVASEELVCDQLMQSAEILAQSVEYLSNSVDETFVYYTYGNHGRTVPNKNDSIHRDNMERLVPWWLKQRLIGYKNITVVEDTGNEFVYFSPCGVRMCAVHGDNDRIQASPKLIHTLSYKTGNGDVEYILLGDKHHRESFDDLGVTAMLCGSLCGSDDYANSKRKYSTPSQMLLIVNEDDGVDAEYRLKCD